MEQQRSKIPAEAIELYNKYIHGEISCRDFLEGAKRFAIAGVAATTIIDALMPNYVLGQRVSKTDERIKATYETVPSPNGNGSIKGYLVRPFSADTRTETPAKLPGVIVVHENRGQRTKRNSKKPTSHTKAIFIQAPFMGSTTTRRRNATTEPQPIRHGGGPSSGSTSTCAAVPVRNRVIRGQTYKSPKLQFKFR